MQSQHFMPVFGAVRNSATPPDIRHGHTRHRVFNRGVHWGVHGPGHPRTPRPIRRAPATFPAVSGTARNALARLEPPTIDVKANIVEERESRQPMQAFPAASPRRKTARFDSMKTSPGSACEVRSGALRRPRRIWCPKAQGSSKALSATRREAGPTSCSSQAVFRDNRFPWSSCFTAAPSRPTISPPALG